MKKELDTLFSQFLDRLADAAEESGVELAPVLEELGPEECLAPFQYTFAIEAFRNLALAFIETFPQSTVGPVLMALAVSSDEAMYGRRGETIH